MPNIVYKSLEFKNAYIYRYCKFQLDKQGLVLIRGLNLDDGGFLGSGKSSLFEVFSNVQMGRGGKKETVNDMVNAFVGSGFEARLLVAVDAKDYEIVQWRKHPEHGNTLCVFDVASGRNLMPKAGGRGRGALHKWLRDNILQTDTTTFFHLIYLAQEFSNVMINGRSADRQAHLTSMFNLQLYDELYKQVKVNLSSFQEAISDLDSIKAKLEEVKHSLSDAPDLDEVEAVFKEKSEKLEALKEAVGEKMSEFTRLAELHSQIKMRKEYVEDVRKAFKAGKFEGDLADPREITDEYVADVDLKYEKAHAAYITTKNSFEVESRRKTLTAQLSKLEGRSSEEINRDLEELQSKLKALQYRVLPKTEDRESILAELQSVPKPTVTVEVLEAELQSALASEAQLKSTVDTVTSQIEKAVCPTCQRPFEMSKRDINRLKKSREEARTKLEETGSFIFSVKRKLQIARKYTQLTSRLNAIQTTRSSKEVVAEIKNLKSNERRLSEELDAAGQRRLLLAQLQELPPPEEEDLHIRVQRLKRMVDTLNARSSAAKQILGGLKKLKEIPSGNLEEIAQKRDHLKSKLDQAHKFVSKSTKDVSSLSAQVNDVRRLLREKLRLERAIEDKEAMISEIRCLEALKKAFSSKGLKQRRFQTILQDATNKTIQKYSRILWPSSEVYLGLEEADTLQFYLERASGTTTTSNLLSGGERHKTGLCLLFGMRDLKEIYTEMRSNVLIIDEPFGGLDPLGAENLIGLFARLKERFSSIFVISHRPEVLEHPVWDQTWWAIRENNNATLYTSEPPAAYKKIARELARQ